jgi:hypothetical protein
MSETNPPSKPDISSVVDHLEKLAKPFVGPVTDLTNSSIKTAEKLLSATTDAVSRGLKSLADRAGQAR